MSIKEYFSSLFKGIYSLIKGMEVTGKELVTPKVTEQYPENRDTLKIPERFSATVLTAPSKSRPKWWTCPMARRR